MHPLKIVLAVALLAPSLAPAASQDWETVGVRVAPREVVTQEGPRMLPYVIAVQDQSPAFFAGVEPGDVISFLRCGRWTWNYIDNEPYGTTYYRTHSSVGATDTGNLRADTKQACSRFDLGGLISVSRPENAAKLPPEFLEFRTAAPKSGQWLTSKATVVSAASDARVAQGGLLADLHSRAATELRKSPCSYDVSNAYNTASMPPLIQQMVQAARSAGGQEDVLFWRDAMWGYCSDEKNGPLPSFETAVWLMSTGHLKPCDFDPAKDYRFTLDYEKRQRPISWNEYERMKDLDYMLRRNDATQHECFFEAVRNAMGKP
jgi:hypothetical protein